MLILVFAVYTFSSGLAIKDATGNIFFSRTTNQGEENHNLEKRQDSRGTNEQVVQMSITARGFQPSALRIKKNVPVRWVIRGDNVSGCTNKIIVPSLDIEKPISFGENVIFFTPDKSGEIPFSCWMGMVRGKFVVE